MHEYFIRLFFPLALARKVASSSGIEHKEDTQTERERDREKEKLTAPLELVRLLAFAALSVSLSLTLLQRLQLTAPLTSLARRRCVCGARVRPNRPAAAAHSGAQ